MWVNSMEPFGQLVSAIALMLGVAWASGLNLYAAIVTLGLLSHSGSVVLPDSLRLVEHPVVLTVAGVLFFVEFFADKVPGIDTAWDSVQTFIRIPAGAVLAASSLGTVDPGVLVAAGLIGASVSAGSHFTKAGARVLINTSPEPVSNWTASFLEDISVVIGIWTALHHPWLFLVVMVLFFSGVAWFLPRLFRGLSQLFRRIVSYFQPRYTAEH